MLYVWLSWVAIFSALSPTTAGEAFSAIDDVVKEYQAHWFGVLGRGVSTTALEGVSVADLHKRNGRNKEIIFDPDVDPVWERITAMIGQDAVDTQRALLIGEDE